MRASVLLHFALATLATLALAPPARADIRYETEIWLKDIKDKTRSQSLEGASQLVALEGRFFTRNPALDVPGPSSSRTNGRRR